MRASYYIAGLLMLLCRLSHGAETPASSDQIASSQLPLEARNADISGEEDVISTSYVLPNQIFNDGKPYYARQDPVSGQLDFNDKKPAGIEPEVNEVLNSKEKIVLNGGSSPNIHDFLNLPVKYSSSKFVYPLVSSSYANLKYQGSNKNYVTNKKPTLVAASVTPVPPTYHSENYFPVTTTKLTAVTPTQADFYATSTRASTPRPTTTTAASTTTPKPVTTTQTTTTVRYTTTTRRTIPSTVSTTPVPPRTSPTRKKFIPTRKYIPSSTLPTIPSTAATKTEQQQKVKLPGIVKQPKPTLSSAENTFTTHHPTPPAAIFPTDPTTTTKMYSTSSTSSPIVFTEPASSTTPSSLTTLIDGTKIPNLDPADVYHTLGQKNTKVQQEQQQAAAKPPMTLSDIFNSLAEEENAVAHNYQQNQGFDAQGNLIEPIAPSQPSPFAMQSQQSGPTTVVNPPPQYPTDQKVISGSLESYGNEYVSYQVQQPNVMQYRPIPGQINNVVISPGQNSASFVLGSQQQVSHPNTFGQVEKEPLFPKDQSSSVQYGQVINEDIGNIKRPQPSNQHQFPPAQQPTPPSNYQQMPNVQSNSKFQTNMNKPPNAPETTVAGGGYQEPPPEAPTPYQQLPLIGSNLRPTKKQVPKVPDTIVSTTNNQLMHTSKPTTSLNQPAINNQDTKELLVSTNIRFPANNEESLEQQSSIVPGPPAGPNINGHAQPLSLQQIQNANPVVFPKIMDEEPAGPNVQIQQHEVLNINQHKQQLAFPAQQNDLTEQQLPSQEMKPPPRYAPLHGQSPPGNRPNGPPAPHFYKEFDRKAQQQPQQQSPSGPRPSINLPNILPQFRPNAKISNGHNPNAKQEPGNIRLPGQGLRQPYNPSTPPQFAHRRQPLQQQQMPKRYPLNRISEYEYGGGPSNGPGDMNRRLYRLPPNAVQRMPQLRDRMYARRPSGPIRTVDSYPVERHAPQAPEPYKLNAGDLDDFEEEDLVIDDPPQAPNKERQTPSEPKLEAVVTLQMLQSQKKSPNSDDTGAGEIQVTADNDPQEALALKVNEQKIDQADMYLVYPKDVSQTPIEATISEIRDPMSAAVEYQNTPFSVIRDQPQEPILKNKKPQSLQQQTKTQQLPKQKFPYPIEKPDPSYTELQPAGQVPGVLIAPRIINSAFSTGTEAPIAIAYTPTEPNTFRRNGPAPAPAIFSETQTEEILSNDFDIRGQNFEKDFMAPFYPSASLGGANGSPAGQPMPSNWKIVPSASDQTIYEKNSINRADVEATVEKKEREVETKNATNVTTEKQFELDSFQPQLQGGFRPIYPPDYMHVEQKEEAEESDKKPLALALAATAPQTTPVQTVEISTTPNLALTQTTVPSSSSRTPTTTIITTTTVLPGTTKLAAPADEPQPALTTKPLAPKKSTFETSLAALLFGEDEEYEDGARKSLKSVEKAPIGPRNVARMGPRSLFS